MDETWTSNINPVLDDIRAILNMLDEWRINCSCAGDRTKFCESFGCATLDEIEAKLKRWDTR